MRIASILLAALALIPPAASAAPCGGFTDVDDSNPGIVPFCASVEWIRNRAITLGCEPNLYCPNGNVSRLQMAAFLKRLADVLIHRHAIRSDQYTTVDLTSDKLLCFTNHEDPAIYERRAVLTGNVSAASGGAGPSTFRATLVYTSDEGVNVISGGGGPAQATTPDSATWVNAAAFNAASLDAGVTYRFGIHVQAVGATTALSAVSCTLSVDIRHKDIDD